MQQLKIDRDVCTGCGLCAKICGPHVIWMHDGQPREEYAEECILCGHCVAVCPVNAITHQNMDMANFKPRIPPQIMDDQMYHLIRDRRSTRLYKDMPLNKEDIARLLEAVRYSPTANNAQDLEFLVIINRQQLDQIRAHILSLMRRFSFVFPRFKKHVRAWERGKDSILRNATTLIIVHSKQKDALHIWDAGIASAHLMLMAETMHIGTCCFGYHAALSKLSPQLRKITGMPKKHHVLASVLLGYPKVSFQRWVDRKPVKFRLFE